MLAWPVRTRCIAFFNRVRAGRTPAARPSRERGPHGRQKNIQVCLARLRQGLEGAYTSDKLRDELIFPWTQNINGIQYHLQMYVSLHPAHHLRGLDCWCLSFRSKAHFTAALSHSRSPSDASAAAAQLPHMAEQQAYGSESANPPRKRKDHRCPHEGCGNSYKQRTGLQYHLAHVRGCICTVLCVIHPMMFSGSSRKRRTTQCDSSCVDAKVHISSEGGSALMARGCHLFPSGFMFWLIMSTLLHLPKLFLGFFPHIRLVKLQCRYRDNIRASTSETCRL